MTVYRRIVSKDGRFRIPAKIRKSLSLRDGDTLTMEIFEGKIILRFLKY